MTEPMMMGSPQSPQTPGSPNQSAFLPAFLMGDHSMTSSPNPKIWSAHARGSPPKSLNRSILTSPGYGNKSVYDTPRSEPRPRDLLAPRGKDKPGAPPVKSLLDDLASPNSGLDSSALAHGSSLRPYYSPYSSVLETPGQTHTSALNQSNLNISQKPSMSPAQMDPFYTQGENITADDDLDETWVTVFGFPVAAASYVLQEFSQFGNILKHVISPEGNWMHLHYQSKIQAKKALSKSGKVFGKSIMVGVSQCIDKNIMYENKENSVCGNSSHITSPLHYQSTNSMLNQSSSRNTPTIRPLTAAYKAARSDTEVANRQNTPQKSNNIVSKAMEYMFGW